MKKSLIALAVLAASGAAMAQSSVTLFGVVDTGVGYVKNSGSKNDLNLAGQNNTGLTHSGNTTSRIGFRGVEDLGGGLKAGFWLEAGITPDNGSGAAGGATGPGLEFKRRSTISLAGGFGEVRMGRELTAGYVKTSSYDMFAQNGVGQFMGWSHNLTGVNSDMNAVRASNMLSYYTPNFGGFTGAVNYSFGEQLDSNKTNRYVGGYAAYDNGPLSVTLGLDKNNGASALSSDTDRSQWALGASYDFGMLKASALYQRVKLENVRAGETGESKFNNMLIGVSAPVGPGTIKAQYAAYDHKGDKDDARQFSLGYVYDMSKRTAVYGTASFLKNKGNANFNLVASGLGLAGASGKSQNGFQVGVRHAF